MKDYNFARVGTELEGFLVTERQLSKYKIKRNIYNARKLFDRELGKVIKLTFADNTEIFPDGTALEATTYPAALSSSYYIIHYMNEAKKHLKSTAEFFKKKLLITSYLRACNQANSSNEDNNIFIEPGNRFSSEKVLYNAYSSTCKLALKKEDGDVSFRTAGFHIHFSFHEQISHKIFTDIKNHNDLVIYGALWPYKTQTLAHSNPYCNTIIAILDDITDKLLVPKMSTEERLREELYATRGDFRIKTDTICGLPTLEYRRLSAEFVNKDTKLIEEFFKQVYERIWSFAKVL